jgi:hypothetical protein
MTPDSIPARDPAPLNILQAFDDAAAFRTARAAEPCPDCDAALGAERCDDHAVDLVLIKQYRRGHAAATRALPPGPLVGPFAATAAPGQAPR